MVGGAVLTQEYADMIGADFYSKDAMGSVRYANELAEKVLNCDVLVLATPVYFYSMSGQLKVFIDRLNPIYQKEK